MKLKNKRLIEKPLKPWPIAIDPTINAGCRVIEVTKEQICISSGDRLGLNKRVGKWYIMHPVSKLRKLEVGDIIEIVE